MREYRENNESENRLNPAPQGASARATRKGDSLANLLTEFGLEDMGISNLGQNEQTVNQEYQAYVTAQLSETDILRFWEVGGYLSGACVTDMS